MRKREPSPLPSPRPERSGKWGGDAVTTKPTFLETYTRVLKAIWERFLGTKKEALMDQRRRLRKKLEQLFAGEHSPESIPTSIAPLFEEPMGDSSTALLEGVIVKNFADFEEAWRSFLEEIVAGGEDEPKM